MEIQEQFSALIQTVKRAGLVAREYFDSEALENEQKSDGSVVTRVDREIEQILRGFVQKHFPEDAIIGEEGDAVEGTSGFVWHIDPIDGTDNFLRKIPFCAISVARLGEVAEDSFAVVYNPITEHSFASLMEGGVYENQRLANLTAEPLGGRYVVSTGLGKSEPWMRSIRYPLAAAIEERFGKCQSYGCSALETAYLAAGRIDAYLTCGLHTYDYAAGLYLVKAAGGQISVFEDGAWHTWTASIKSLCAEHGRTILASHPEVHERIRDFIGDPRRWADQNKL